MGGGQKPENVVDVINGCSPYGRKPAGRAGGQEQYPFVKSPPGIKGRRLEFRPSHHLKGAGRKEGEEKEGN